MWLIGLQRPFLTGVLAMPSLKEMLQARKKLVGGIVLNLSKLGSIVATAIYFKDHLQHLSSLEDISTSLSSVVASTFATHIEKAWAYSATLPGNHAHRVQFGQTTASILDWASPVFRGRVPLDVGVLRLGHLGHQEH